MGVHVAGGITSVTEAPRPISRSRSARTESAEARGIEERARYRLGWEVSRGGGTYRATCSAPTPRGSWRGADARVIAHAQDVSRETHHYIGGPTVFSIERST